MSRVLYLTTDGVLDPLGTSQVVRVVERLARRGTPYDLVSLERATSLARPGAVAAMQDRLGAAGVAWTHATFSTNGGGRSAATNAAVLTGLALRRAWGLRLVHARSYMAGLVALGLARTLRIPYLFDVRGYWVDERLEEGRWFTRRTALLAARRTERALYGRAAGIVTLTDLQRNDVVSEDERSGRQRPIVTITTCADFDEFGIAAPSFAGPRAVLRGKHVVALIGALNHSYLVDESVALVRRVIDRRADAHALVISAQAVAWSALLEAAGVPETRRTIVSVAHDDMAAWLRCANWAILLLRRSAAKRASMPTKLGELFASGVRPAFHGCNDEAEEWVRRTGSGIVLPDVAATALDRAAAAIAEPRPVDELARAREIARDHFDLARCVQRYESILTELGVSGSR